VPHPGNPPEQPEHLVRDVGVRQIRRAWPYLGRGRAAGLGGVSVVCRWSRRAARPVS